MWDTVQTPATHLSHDLPCPACGHEVHTHLVCGNGCACPPMALPGAADRSRDGLRPSRAGRGPV